MDRDPPHSLGALGGPEQEQGDPRDEGRSEVGSEEGEARRPVAQWTVADVCLWLRRGPLGLLGSPLVKLAHSHALSGKALLRMTEETLERMGITPSRLRRELLKEVLYLRLQQEMEELLDITDERSPTAAKRASLP